MSYHRRLLAAIDDSDKLKYLSVIIADEEWVNNNGKVLPPTFTHMNKMPNSEKIKLLHQFNFKGSITCCINFDLILLRNSIDKYKVSKRSRNLKRKISAIVSYELKYVLQEICSPYILNNECTIDELVFEVDNDMVKEYLECSGLRTTFPNIIHKIADCVVHSNYHQWHIDNVNDYGGSFRKNFHERVMEQIRNEIKK